MELMTSTVKVEVFLYGDDAKWNLTRSRIVLADNLLAERFRQAA